MFVMATTTAFPDVFHAIADGNRRKLMDLLGTGEKPVQELVRHFDISFAAVSQHLNVLRAAGLVSRRAEGRKRLYRLTPTALREVHDWTEQYREFWQGRLDELGRYLERQEAEDKKGD